MRLTGRQITFGLKQSVGPGHLNEIDRATPRVSRSRPAAGSGRDRCRIAASGRRSNACRFEPPPDAEARTIGTHLFGAVLLAGEIERDKGKSSRTGRPDQGRLTGSTGDDRGPLRGPDWRHATVDRLLGWNKGVRPLSIAIQPPRSWRRSLRARRRRRCRRRRTALAACRSRSRSFERLAKCHWRQDAISPDGCRPASIAPIGHPHRRSTATAAASGACFSSSNPAAGAYDQRRSFR